jgi:hypothetical protein
MREGSSWSCLRQGMSSDIQWVARRLGPAGPTVLLIELCFTWRSIRATERNLQLTQEITARNLAIALDGQITSVLRARLSSWEVTSSRYGSGRFMPWSGLPGIRNEITGRLWKS